MQSVRLHAEANAYLRGEAKVCGPNVVPCLNSFIALESPTCLHLCPLFFNVLRINMCKSYSFLL